MLDVDCQGMFIDPFADLLDDEEEQTLDQGRCQFCGKPKGECQKNMTLPLEATVQRYLNQLFAE
jgi:hypothetical protein